MQTVLRPMGWRERRVFGLCVGLSLLAHAVLVWLALPGSANGRGGRGELAERFAQAVNAATDLDPGVWGRLEGAVRGVRRGDWRKIRMAETLRKLSSAMGLPVEGAEVLRALDPERSREGRWDIRVWLRWGPERKVDDVLVLAFLVGEGTLKSDFGSHRFWIHLETPEGSGRLAFQTVDCRLYRNGKLTGPDLLHRAEWFDR